MNSRGGGRFVRWRDMHRRAGEILRQLEVDIDPRSLASQLTRRRPAGGRDRQGDVPRRPGADHGRADRRAVGARGAAPVPAGPPARRSRASPCCSSAIASTRCSSSATGSPCSATASTSRRSATADVTEATLIRDMVGRELADFFHRTATSPATWRSSVEGLGRRGAFHDVTFEVRAGRGARLRRARRLGAHRGGRGAVRRVAGRRRRRSGAAAWPSRSTARATAMDHGIAYVSEDRRRLGLSLPQSVTAQHHAGRPAHVRVALAARRPRRRAAHGRQLPAAPRHPHAVAVDARRPTCRAATSRR